MESCKDKWKADYEKEFHINQRVKNSEILKVKRDKEMAILRDKEEKIASLVSLDERKQQSRIKKIAKMEADLARKIEKNKKHSELSNKIVLQILELVDVKTLNP